ncbi:hypothetical protein AMC82_CH00351 [Rhizobium phaseoli]|nr:hypothetical protein AMC84_CH00352 [Rhizobium phaseoli]ANL76872.1 hypothetical protein AMC82_CH00351 [Rhizobium phaseoli]
MNALYWPLQKQRTLTLSIIASWNVCACRSQVTSRRPTGNCIRAREMRECNAVEMAQAIRPDVAMPSSNTPRMMR